MIIRLTEKGKEYQQPQDDFSDLFVRFSQEELAQFDQYLDRLLETAQSLQPDGEESDEKRRREWMKNARSRMGDARFEQLCAMHPRPFGPAPDHGRSHGCPEEGFGPADFGPKGFGPRGYGPEDFGPKGFGPRDCGPADFDPGDFGPAGFGPMGGRPRPHEPGRSMDWENAGKPGLKDHGHGCYHSKSGCEKTVETDERPGHHYFKGRRAESEEETELQAKPVQEADEKNSVNDKIQSQETEAKQSE